MGILDKVKISNFTNFFGLSDDEYVDYEGDVERSTPNFAQPKEPSAPKASTNVRKSTPIRVESQQTPQTNTQNQGMNTRQNQQVRVQQTSRLGQTPLRQQAAPMRQAQTRPTQQMPTPKNQFAQNQPNRQVQPQTATPRIPQAVASNNNDAKVVDLQTAQSRGNGSPATKGGTGTNTRKTNETLKIAIKEPRVYSEAMDIGKILMNQNAVLVNFHLMEEHSAARCVDFFTGIVYAIEGDIQRVGSQIFLCTPANITIDGNQARSLLHEHNFDI
ncbi:MAG: cell division protein SepF [Streptococcaceae bacterium]|jgi:cell division inhibitor SepF|nr:cell division protein SepF [Streptococcaceae bacterium]